MRDTPATAAVLLLLAATPPAAAQTADTDPSFPLATAESDHIAGLPDITVTARRRVEDAQRVPGSLSVVGGALLDRSYTVNTQQLSQLVPALNYSSANPRNTAFTIRGLGSSVVAVSQANDGLESGVGFYVDQVYHARPATAAFDFSDIGQAAEFDGTVRPLETQMADDAALWRRIAERENLVESDLSRLASPWHTDADLGRPIEVVTDISKSRRLGFTAYQPTDDAFFDLFTDRLIP